MKICDFSKRKAHAQLNKSIELVNWDPLTREKLRIIGMWTAMGVSKTMRDSVRLGSKPIGMLGV